MVSAIGRRRSIQTEQRQKLHSPSNRGSSFAFKFVLFLFISILARIVFFRRVGIFSQIDDELQEHQYRHNFAQSPKTRLSSIGRMRATATKKGHSQQQIDDQRERRETFRAGSRSAINDGREKAETLLESDAEEVEESPEAGNSEDEEGSDVMENINGEREKKLAEPWNSEDEERSTDTESTKEEEDEKLAEDRNSEDEERSADAESTEEEGEEKSAEDRNSEDEERSADAESTEEKGKGKSAEDRNSDDMERSADAESTEEEEDDKLAEDRNSEDMERSDETENEDEKEQSAEEEEEDMYFRDPNVTVVNWNYFPPSKREPRRDASWTQTSKSTSKLFTLNEKECDRLMINVDTSPPPMRKASNEACEGYNGVLHIHHFDSGAASGTAFFSFTIGMLAWADQHNYLPWIHIEDGYTRPIWDPIVHTNTTNATFEMKTGMGIEWARDPNDSEWHIFPGKPFRERPLKSKKIILHGTGVWEHYFLPPNDFVPGDLSCRNKPIIKMTDDQIVPGIHANAPWAPRAWRSTEAPYILRSELSWDEWFKTQREHAAEITKRYIRFNPVMERRAHCAFPNPEFSLGMHIRHGDKYLERQIIETDRFLVFAEAFVNNGGHSIYLATDSAKVVETILENWPKHVADHVIYQKSVLGLTLDDKPAFDLGVSPHRTNVEALTDVLALSKSTYFLHGLSAMSEAVLYLNPGLVARSINLEDELYSEYRPESFVKSFMQLGKTQRMN